MENKKLWPELVRLKHRPVNQIGQSTTLLQPVLPEFGEVVAIVARLVLDIDKFKQLNDRMAIAVVIGCSNASGTL
jgi:hypothetical protein